MELLAQTTYEYSYEVSSGGISPVVWFIWLGIWLISIVALWKVFEKAGYEGWKSIIPFYNLYIMFEIAGMSGWMFLLMLVPFVNFVMMFVLAFGIAKAFGKSGVFAVFGLVFFSFVGYLMLGFGEAKYVNPGPEESKTTE